MDRIDYAVERLRYMYRNDPIMDALYRGEINWGDIPDDDKPLELISWKEIAKEEERLQSLTKKAEETGGHQVVTETQPSIVSPSSPWRKPDTCLSPLLKISEFPSLHESITLTAPAKTAVSKAKSTVFTFERSGTPPTPTKKTVYQPPQKKESATKKKTTATTTTTTQTKPKKKESPKSVPGKRTLFVHELPSKTTILELRAYFEKYGPIISITLPKYTDASHPKYDLCKGFGHIRFEKPEDAMTAFTKEKSTIHIHNKRIQIEFVKNEA